MANRELSGFEYYDSITETRSEVHPFRFRTNSGYRTVNKAILFGSNGSGKTTLGTSLLESAVSGRLTYIDYNSEPLNGNSAAPASVRVFNEETISAIAKFSEDGLGTIVLLGEQIETEEAIKAKTELLQYYQAEKRQAEDISKIAEARKKEINSTIGKILRSESGWASRAQSIRGLKQKAPVRTDEFVRALYENYTSTSPKPLARSLEEFHNEVADFLNESNADEVKPVQFAALDFEKLEEVAVACETVDSTNKAHHTEKDIVPLEVAESKKNLQEARAWFNSIGDAHCPRCYQEINQIHKIEALRLIDLHLSYLNTGATPAIPSYKFPVFEFHGEDFDNVDVDTTLIQSNIDRLNEEIHRITSLIEQKIDSPNSTVDLDIQQLEYVYKDCSAVVEEANQSIKEFNIRVNNVREKKENLEEDNLLIAYSELEDDLERLAWTEAVQHCAEVNEHELDGLVHSVEDDLANLESAKSNTREAAERVNHYLNLVFFDPNRLRISPSENHYTVYSRGARVSPSQLSTGERNIIALCYFFVRTNSGLSVDSFFSRPQLIVLDDPISSFDGDNKYGVFSFLISVFRDVINGNKENRILVLTHDFPLATQFETAFKNLPGDASPVQSYANGSLRKADSFDKDVYLSLLHEVYEYAQLSDEDLSNGPILAANNPRRLVEGFFHFIAGEKVSDFTTADSVLDVILDRQPQVKEYFHNSMIRLYLHPESHSEDQISAGNYTLSNSFNSLEVRRMCRDVLVLMDIEAPAHIAARIGTKRNRSSIRSSLDSWRSQVPRSLT